MTASNHKKRQKLASATGKNFFKPGYIVALEFSAVGGVTYEREDLREEEIGDGMEAEFKTIKRVDDTELHKESRAIISQAYYMLERVCTPTPLGHYADAAQLLKLREKLAPLKEAAGIFNELARRKGSRRRVVLEIYPIGVDTDDEAAAARLAQVVRERLSEALASLQSGDTSTRPIKSCRNLERLASGIQADAVKLAVEQLRERRNELAEQLREEPGSDARKLASKLDLQAVEQAVVLFTDEQSLIDRPEVDDDAA